MPKTDVANLLEKLKDKKWIESFKKSKGYEDRLKLIRNYNILEKDEEAVIQLLVDRFDPPLPSVTNVDIVRNEMALEEAKGWPSGKDLTTAEGEAYWQELLDKAEAKDLAERKRIINEHLREINEVLPELGLLRDIEPEEAVEEVPRDKVVEVDSPSDLAPVDEETPAANLNFKIPAKKSSEPVVKKAVSLKALNGMNTEAIEKLNKAGIINADQLFEKTYEDALEIVGSPLVLDKLKDKFAKKQK